MAHEPQRSTYAVTLLAADGKEQPIDMDISPKGVMLLGAEGKVLHQFSQEAVRKCVPSIARSRRTGGPDCVDLVVVTSRGTRELRMRCAAQGDVQTILQHVASDIVRPRGGSRGSSRGGSSRGGSRGGGGGGSSVAPSSGGDKPHERTPPQSRRLSMRSTAAHGESLLADEPLVSRRVPTVRYARHQLPELLMQGQAATAAGGDANGRHMPQLTEEPIGPGDDAAAAWLSTAHMQPQPSPARVAAPWEQAAEEADAALDAEHNALVGGQSAAEHAPPQPHQHAQMGGVAAAAPGDAPPATPHGAELPPSSPQQHDGGAAAPCWSPATSDAQSQPRHEPQQRQPQPQQQQTQTQTQPAVAASGSASGVGEGGGAGGGQPCPGTGPPTRRTTSQIEVQAHSDLQLQLLKEEAAASKAGVMLVPDGRAAYRARRGGGSATNDELRMSSWGTGAGGHVERIDQLSEENAALRAEVESADERSRALEQQVARMGALLEDWAHESLTTAQECVHAKAGRAAAERDAARLAEAVAQLRGADALAQASAARAEAASAALHDAEAAAAEELAHALEVHRTLADEMQQAAAASATREVELSCERDELRGWLAEAETAAANAHGALVEEKRGRAEDARVADATHKSWKQEHLVQRAELLEVTRRLSACLGEQARLEAELDALQATHKAAAAELLETRAQLGAAREQHLAATAALEAHDADNGAVHAALAAARADAAEQRAVCEQALRGQGELRREVEVQRERLASVRLAAQEQARAEMQVLVEAGRSELEAAREETEGVAAHLAEQTAICAQLRADIADGARQVTELHDEVAEAEEEKARLGAMSLSAMAKIQALEAERDELASRCSAAEAKVTSLASTRDAMEGAMQNERGTVEEYVVGLRAKINDAECRALASAAEVRDLRHQLEVSEKELTIARLSTKAAEEEAAHAAAQVRERHEGELRHAASQLESTLQICQAAVSEAEGKLAAKDATLARWRTEADTISANLEAALAEHRREQDDLVRELDDARATAQALSLERERLLGELARAQAATGAGARQDGGLQRWSSPTPAVTVAGTEDAAAAAAVHTRRLGAPPGGVSVHTQSPRTVASQRSHGEPCASPAGVDSPAREWQARVGAMARLASVHSSPASGVFAGGAGATAAAAAAAAGEPSPLKPTGGASTMRRTVSVLAVSPEAVEHL